MSVWSYIRGRITVSPMGRTQHEKLYILNTVLDHLPRVSGSEGDMDVYAIQPAGHNESSSCDEFGEHTNNLTDRMYGGKSYARGWLELQRNYILVLDGNLRDRGFEESKRDFMQWLCRLAKRVYVSEILVSIESENKCILLEDADQFADMFEEPSWFPTNETHEPTWCEYLMWDRAKNSDWPVQLLYKYYEDSENDAEFERRYEYKRRKRR